MGANFKDSLSKFWVGNNSKPVRNSWDHTFFLPLLILITPFIHFLNHHDYCFICPEALIIILSLAIVAIACSLIFIIGWNRLYWVLLAILITVFIDLQFEWMNNIYEVIGSLSILFFLIWGVKNKFRLIATTVFGTFFAVTLVQSAPFFADDPFPITKPFFTPQGSPPPRLIHLILDEHIGIEGIPTGISGGKALKDKLIDFYRMYGFHLFAGAYSHYFQTHYSIPSLMNLSGRRDQHSNIEIDRDKSIHHKLLHNTYFEILDKRGYNINVLGPQYIDYCMHSQTLIQHCNKYNSFKMQPVTDLEIPVLQKINLLLSRYLSGSYLKNKIAKTVYLFIRISSSHIIGISFPPWSWESSTPSLRMHSINSMQLINDLGENIMALPEGNAFIVHLLFPHFPYIAKPDCSIKNPSDWEDKTNWGGGNTAETRNVRYPLYFEQIACLYSRLDGIFKQMQAAKIFDDSIIILHGDHGSRISIRDPLVKNRDVLTEEDIQDHFSTLFAVKFPGKEWNYDASPRPLEQLMAHVTTELTGFSQTAKEDPPGNFVYLQDQKTLSRIPYPWAQ